MVVYEVVMWGIDYTPHINHNAYTSLPTNNYCTHFKPNSLQRGTTLTTCTIPLTTHLLLPSVCVRVCVGMGLCKWMCTTAISIHNTFTRLHE